MKEMGEYIYRCMESMGVEMLGDRAEANATRLLSQIQRVLFEKDTDDFEKIEKIVSLLEGEGVSSGGCHDFS